MKRLQIEHRQAHRRRLQCVIVTLVVTSLSACAGGDGKNPSAPPDDGPTAFEPVCPADLYSAVDALDICGGLGVICVGYHDGSSLFDLEPLTSGASPAWSPDGLKIAFHRGSGDGQNFDVYLINADGTDEQRLTAGREPAWSPDGNWLAFTSGDGISVIRKDGTGTATLIRHDAVPGFSLHAPAWSPDGQQIAYAETGGEGVLGGRIQIMNADGGNPRRVTPEGKTQVFEDYPAWSPSGDRIAFNTSYRAVAIIDVAGGDPRLVLDSLAEVSRSTWSPEGTQLAYTNDRCGPSPAIHSVGVEGRPAQVLIRQAREPAWSPDGARLAFVTAGGAAYLSPDAFPLVTDIAEVYVRESGDSPGFLSRYVLFPTGRFELQYLSSRWGYFSYSGSFTRTGADLRFHFDDSNIAGSWQATGVLDGNRLRIEYNITMILSDFEDGVYVRSGG